MQAAYDVEPNYATTSINQPAHNSDFEIETEHYYFYILSPYLLRKIASTS